MAKTFDRERLKKLFAQHLERHDKAHREYEAKVADMHKRHAKARQDLHDKHQKGRQALFDDKLKGMKGGPKGGAPIYKTRVKE